MIKTRKLFALSGMLLFIGSSSIAQSYVESALLFSRTRPSGSARIQAMGGSQIALGGDYSSGLSNPAGLGMYNRSEFTFSPGLSFYETDAQYLSESESASKSTFNIPGLSVVFHMPLEKSGFVGGSFAISLSRTNDFNRSISYQGKNDDTSIIDYFIDNAFGSTTDQFDPDNGFQYNTPTGLAYFNYLIGPIRLDDPNGPDDEYFSDVKTIPDQREEIETRGASNQWSFSYGANYKDILFIGGGIGVTTLRYKSQKIYAEAFSNDPVFNNLQLDETLDLKGNGINATLGAIVRPADFIQVGVSFTSPTYYEFTETYNAEMNTSWKNFDYYGDGETILNNESASTDVVTSDYSLTTPLKLSAGMALLSKYGFLTGDIEFTNPGRAKYSSNMSGISFNQENDDIRSVFRSTVNYRLGGEFRYKILRVRAGYGVQANAYKNDFDLDNSIKTISGGLGVRFQKFFADFALAQSKGTNFYSPYSFNVYNLPNPIVEIENKTLTGILTVGFTF
jgi:hypothetical protein